MKKLRILPLLLLVLLIGLCATASAATISGQQTILSVEDAQGRVTSLTDDDPATAWTVPGYNDGQADLTINLYGTSVGEIWIRSGYAYTANWFNHYDRPDVIKVTVYYEANRYTTSYDTYRYRLKDEYRPSTVGSEWNSGYQRLLLPKKYTGVTKIEITIESVVAGYGNTGATISDVIVAGGSHATATPKAYATATPKPYVVYVTPTPGPYTDDDVYYPEDDEDDEPLVEVVTRQPTATPYIKPITPTPMPDATKEPVIYPSTTGTRALLVKRIATRSGPSNYFDEPGSFFSAGDEVKVLSKAWDNENEIWWFQVEFQYDGEWYRAYTPASRIDLSADYVPTETTEPFETVIGADTRVFFGPGTEYREFRYSVAYAGYAVKVYAVEGDWAQIEYYDWATEARRRGWVVTEDLAEMPRFN